MDIMKKKKSVVLITFYDLDSFAVHTLHAVLKKSGHDVHSIFFKTLNINSTANAPTEADISRLIQLISKLNPDIVGISFRSTFFKLAKTITEEIRKNLDALIVWGGIHPTIKPTQCIEIADIVCVGEGEGAIVELAKRLADENSIDDIKNLWIRKDGKIIKNDLRLLIQDLDSLPFPDFSIENKYFIENGSIESLIPPDKRTDYSIMTSRGCPFRCTYCYNNIAQEIYKDKGKYVRRRSVGNVIEELLQAKKNFKNLNYISFLDDLFTFDKKWVKEFSEQYKKSIHLAFYCHIHPKFADEEMIKVLKESGCAGITIGIQTGSENSRYKYFERYETNDQIVKATEILHKQGIDCTYDLIMDNPLETDQDKRETFNLLLRLPRPFKLCVHSLTHFPETKLTKILLEKKIITDNDVEDQKQKSYDRWVPALDLDRDKENMFWDNLYYLTQKKYVSAKFLVWLSDLKFLKMHPKPLTFFLRLTSFSIYTIRTGSKLDGLRWAVLTIINKPHLLFKKRSWFFLWSKIKSRCVCLVNGKDFNKQ
jgi:anaerobic magnesium-protoporphyrin IX monomethyl ester cyclase